MLEESAAAACLGLGRVHLERVVRAPGGMRHLVGAATDGLRTPAIDEIEHKRTMCVDGRAQRGPRCPSLETDSRDTGAGRAGGVQRHRYAVASQDVASLVEPFDQHLHPFDRQVDVPGQEVSVRQICPPPHEATSVGLVPESGDQRADKQRLDQCHLRIRRHLEGSKRHGAQSATIAVGAKEFVDAKLGTVSVAGEVDEYMPEQAVDQPRRHVVTLPAEFDEGDFEAVDRVDATLINARSLAGGPNELAREQIRHRRMVLPEGDHARK